MRSATRSAGSSLTGSIFNRNKHEQNTTYRAISKDLKKSRSFDSKNKHDPHRAEDLILSNLPQNLKPYSHALFIVNEFWLNDIQCLSKDLLHELALSIYCHLYTSSPTNAHYLLLKSNEMNIPSHILKILTVFGYTLRQMTAEDYTADSHDKLVQQLKSIGDQHKPHLDVNCIDCNIYELILNAFNSCFEQRFNKTFQMETRFCFTQFYRLIVDLMNDNVYLSHHLSQVDAFVGSLSDCLGSDRGSRYFHLFLQEQLQDENYLFYKAVQDYKSLAVDERIKIGNNIIETYIEVEKETQIVRPDESAHWWSQELISMVKDYYRPHNRQLADLFDGNKYKGWDY
eukprot:314811_1